MFRSLFEPFEGEPSWTQTTFSDSIVFLLFPYERNRRMFFAKSIGVDSLRRYFSRWWVAFIKCFLNHVVRRTVSKPFTVSCVFNWAVASKRMACIVTSQCFWKWLEVISLQGKNNYALFQPFHRDGLEQTMLWKPPRLEYHGRWCSIQTRNLGSNHQCFNAG